MSETREDIVPFLLAEGSYVAREAAFALAEKDRTIAAKDAEIARLREALEPFAAKYEDFTPDEISVRMQMATHPDDLGDDRLALVTLSIGDVRRARAALREPSL